MNNSAANPATQLATQKERLEGRLVKLGARKRGIVMLVEHNCSSFNAISTNKKGKKIVNKHVTQATIVAWVIQDFNKAWMMEPGAKMDFDFAVAYDTDAFSDEDILEVYKRADERDDVEPVRVLYNMLYCFSILTNIPFIPFLCLAGSHSRYQRDFQETKVATSAAAQGRHPRSDSTRKSQPAGHHRD
jgi:hypothetical protein